MSKSPWFGFCGTAALAGLVLVSLAGAAVPVAAPPVPPVPVAPSAPTQAEIDKRLQAAQKQLEQAANEVARLSTQLSDTMLSEVMPLVGPHVIIGVQLEKAADHTGARVREVSPGGPAAEAGIRVDDVIVAVNGTELKGENPPHQLSSILHGVKPDTPLSVRVLRQGKPLDFKVTARGGPGCLAPVTTWISTSRSPSCRKCSSTGPCGTWSSPRSRRDLAAILAATRACWWCARRPTAPSGS